MGQLFMRAYRGLIVLLVMLLVTAGTLLGVGTSPAVADVATVTGSAFGYHAFDVSLFGGDQDDVGPTPTVELEPDASASPQTATDATGEVSYGPGVLFTSDEITVTTAGSVGEGGSVSTSTDIQNVNRSGDEVFDADSVQSSCTASENGVSGSTTVTNGTMRTHAQGDQAASPHDEEVVAIPENPEPGHTVEGHVHLGADSQDNFRYVFNEQIENADGSITVNAVHVYLLGPTLEGEMIIGQSVCGVTATTTPTTTVPTTTVPTTTVPTTDRFTTTTVPTTTVPTTERVSTEQVTTTTVPGDGEGDGTGSVTEVTGSAFGYYAFDVSLFGGAQDDVGPTPTVELEPDASDSPQTATDESGRVAYGPGVLFTSGPITVSTEGNVGEGGSVSSSTDIEDVNRGGSEVLDADRVQSSCTASADGASGSTTVTNGTMRTHAQGDQAASPHDEEVVAVPENPEPGHTIEGHLHIGADAEDRFRYVFNEQIENADGSITVNAVHVHLLGPTLVGEMIIGQSVCAMGASTSGTGTSGGSGDAGGTGGRSGSDSLARTGTDPLPLTMVGLGLLLSGLGTVALQSGRLGRPVEDLRR